MWSWIICDGDIDPDWIESLNTVLDDNRLLSLPSGWRVQFDTNVNFIFETDSLSNASPATVSRVGIVYLSEEDLSVRDVIASFIDKQSEMMQYNLAEYIQEFFYQGKWSLKLAGDVKLLAISSNRLDSK